MYPGQVYSPAASIEPSGYRVILHHVSLIYGRMQMYPGQKYTPSSLNPILTELYYTMSVWYVEECRCTQIRSTPQSNLVVQNPTILCQFDMWKNAGVPRSNVHPLLIEPSATELYYTMSELYYTMSVWYVEECRCKQVRYNPPTTTNQTACYRALLHHVSLTCERITDAYPGQMYSSLLIFEPSAPTEPCYYTMSSLICGQNGDIPRSDIHHPTNQAQCYRSLLHHVSFTCERMQAYPGQMYTPHSLNPVLQSCLLHHVSLICGQNADVPRSDVLFPLPQLNLVVKSPTTPCQFDMWKNADVPRSDIHPLTNWTSVVQRPTAPGQFHMWKNADVPRSDGSNLVGQSPTTPGHVDPPLSMKPQCYRALLHQVSLICGTECRCTQVRCNPTSTTPH